jgi:hypothetical protein
METRRILSALCYFSMFFAGFIFPLVVFFVSEDSTVKNHAKKAIVSHLIPFIPSPLLAISIYYDIAKGGDIFPIYTISSIVVMAMISITVLIWNIVNGVKVLKEK